MTQVQLEYKESVICNLCDKAGEGQKISITLPILSGGLIVSVVIGVYICESCWSKVFKEFKRNK